MKKFLLKEYGSWGVMIISCLTGILAAHEFNLSGVGAFISISLFINSKQAFLLWVRRTGPDSRQAGLIFLPQIIIGSILLLAVAGQHITDILPYAVIPVFYIVLLRFLGEHALATEVAGFVLLALSSLIAKFAVTEYVDIRLFIAVATFFSAGVFKVRLQFTKKMKFRIAMIAYLGGSVVIYHLFQIPYILMLPLIDNLLFSITLYRTALRATGWFEVLKGVIFMVLTFFFYH